jgi:hypothetical protein
MTAASASLVVVAPLPGSRDKILTAAALYFVRD